MKLSKRLQNILDQAKPGMPFWDVCCDHGQLGEKALLSDQFSEVHFVDQVPHIMQALEKRMEHNFSDDVIRGKYQMHLLSGENINLPVSGNLAIAGVGGNTLVKILSSLDVNSFLQAERLILNPATRKEVLINWLEQWAKYKLTSQYSFVEAGIEHAILVLDAHSSCVSV